MIGKALPYRIRFIFQSSEAAPRAGGVASSKNRLTSRKGRAFPHIGRQSRASTKPLHELRYSGFNLRLRIVAKQMACFCDIGESLGHIAGLPWLSINFSAQVQRLLQKRNQFA